MSFETLEYIMSLFTEIFTWWNSATWGTRLHVKRNMVLVGSDEAGNNYFKAKTIDKTLGRERRMVIYKNTAEPSQIPPGWWGWMHGRTDISPIDEKHTPKDWQKPHLSNLTGTAGAYRPEGSVLKSGQRPKATGDYSAWTP
jgi:NADH:ubiquinone oxidoreductase subunit